MIRPSVVYLGRSRLQRNRANLIQTLQMMEAFRLARLDATLYCRHGQFADRQLHQSASNRPWTSAPLGC